MHDYVIVLQSIALGFVGIAIVPSSIQKKGFIRNTTQWAVFLAFSSWWLIVNHGRFDFLEAFVRAVIFGFIPIGAGGIVYWLALRNR
jgi:hypothetical protein